jgi:hypothetical protein
VASDPIAISILAFRLTRGTTLRRVRTLLCLIPLCVAMLAGCGSSAGPATPTATDTSPPDTRPDPSGAVAGGTLYEGGDWAVVTLGAKATALHLQGGAWHADRTGRVQVEILGPHAIAPAMPQVAAQLTAKKPLVESALWVDGKELVAKGGGLTPTRGTIYGAPVVPLTPGKHVVVAYARTATAATAVARAFTVR